ncbi:MAG: hypothetical protein KAS72_04660 [Phycisphaerales bacterium]|nr:hypothetical protein [Phycisphaerales bacterium]
MTTTKTTRPAQTQPPEAESIKETLQSILIAFVLAFVFRSFVVEAFVIPTGSMAPTLLGQHIRFQSPASGFNFTVNPKDYGPGEVPKSRQSITSQNPVLDPMSGAGLVARHVPTRSGDRILVLKYIYSLFEPERFDVVVFKNPTDPPQNFIKRLIGLPNEDIWLVDGDVFVRKPDHADPDQRGWHVQRKPIHIQRDVWQPVYYSQHHPIDSAFVAAAEFEPRWKAHSGDWEIEGRTTFACASSDAATITFDPADEITDYTAFDQTSPAYENPRRKALLNVSDVRIAAGIRPEQDGLKTTISLAARAHVFEAVIADDTATLRMRPEDSTEWHVLDTANVRFGRPGRVTNVEFWHVDQSVSLWIGGERVAYGEYDWSPEQRFANSTNMTFEDIVDHERTLRVPNAMLRHEARPIPCAISWSFAGSPVVLSRVDVDRDLHYRPTSYNSGTGKPALATHPKSIAHLGSDQFFVLGDNSALSSDARVWSPPDPWVAHRIDPGQGVVHRKLMLGKAFFVYWPSMQPLRAGGRLFIPDFGRMRFIR